MAKQDKEVPEEKAEAPIYGDVLESILTHVPLTDLVPACHVSKSWRLAVSTSLRCCNKIKPWLLLYAQRTRHPYSISTKAYDPRSRLWVQITIEPSIKYISTLRSSHSTLLYMLSPFKFSFSFDPLHLTWNHVEPPLVWRADAIVAAVGKTVIIAGGGCDFEDDPLAVELYDLEMRTWDKCDSMPGIFKDSAASTWLSVTVDSDKMYVAEKSTGIAYTFDPATKAWRGPYDLRPDKSVRSSNIGFSNGRLFLIGLTGDNNRNEEVNGLKLWELNSESFEIIREIGAIPKELLGKLKGESCSMWSISANFISNFVYINNSSAAGEIIMCEIGDGGSCSWTLIHNIVASDDCLLANRLVFSCADVGLGDFHRAMNVRDCKFSVKATTF